MNVSENRENDSEMRENPSCSVGRGHICKTETERKSDIRQDCRLIVGKCDMEQWEDKQEGVRLKHGALPITHR